MQQVNCTTTGGPNTHLETWLITEIGHDATADRKVQPGQNLLLQADPLANPPCGLSMWVEQVVQMEGFKGLPLYFLFFDMVALNPAMGRSTRGWCLPEDRKKSKRCTSLPSAL